jgi:hypothetical protein
MSSRFEEVITTRERLREIVGHPNPSIVAKVIDHIAKVSALADFLIAELTDARWAAEVVMGWKPPPQRRKQT